MTGMETGGTVAEYEYNSDGLRISKTVNDERTDFVLEGGYIIAEIGFDNDVTNYVRGLTGIIYRETSDGTKTYYVTNNHGDVTKLVNSSGAAWGRTFFGIFLRLVNDFGGKFPPRHPSGGVSDRLWILPELF